MVLTVWIVGFLSPKRVFERIYFFNYLYACMKKSGKNPERVAERVWNKNEVSYRDVSKKFKRTAGFEIGRLLWFWRAILQTVRLANVTIIFEFSFLPGYFLLVLRWLLYLEGRANLQQKDKLEKRKCNCASVINRKTLNVEWVGGRRELGCRSLMMHFMSCTKQ